jgi:hypothetical protein
MNVVILLLLLVLPAHSWAFDVAARRWALNAGTGTQDITFSDLDEDCTSVTCAAIVIVTTGITDEVKANHAAMWVGFTDGTNSRVAEVYDTDNVSTTSSRRRTTHNYFIETSDPPSGPTGSATFNAWLSNGLQINIDDAFPDTYLATFVIFSGVTATVSDFISNASVDGTTNVNTVGFNPEILLLASNRLATSLAQSGDFIITFGAAVNDGSSSQGSIGCYSRSAATTSNIHANASALYGMSVSDLTGLHAAMLINGWNSSGFVATTKRQGVGAAWNYLALKINGPQFSVISVDTPTATGTTSITTGFKPRFGILMGTLARAYDVDEADSDAGPCMISVFTDNNQYANMAVMKDGVTTTDTGSLSGDKGITMYAHDNTCSAGSCFVGTITSFDDTHVNLNYTSVFSDAVRKWVGFFIEDTTTVARRRGVGIMQ